MNTQTESKWTRELAIERHMQRGWMSQAAHLLEAGDEFDGDLDQFDRAALQYWLDENGDRLRVVVGDGSWRVVRD